MARIFLLFIDVFLDSQLLEIDYTQHSDIPLRQVRTLHLDFIASLAKEVGYFFSSFLPVMASDHTSINYMYI